MIRSFRVGPPASLNQVSKNWEALRGKNAPIIFKIENPKLSVYFRRPRTSQFFDT